MFPALVPLQSLKIRGAIYQYLTELKKEGHLSKNVFIRKSTFDECKGHLFEDLLAAFSNAVLRRSLAQGNGGRLSAAAKLALARTISPAEKEMLLPLCIAYRASLQECLRKKEDTRAKFQKFGEILDRKHLELNEKADQLDRLNTVDRQTYTTASKEDLKNAALEASERWQGDRKWLKSILDGEEQCVHDPLLDVPFEDVWSNVRNGSINDAMPAIGHGIIHELEEDIGAQESRIGRWKQCRADLGLKDGPSSALLQGTDDINERG